LNPVFRTTPLPYTSQLRIKGAADIGIPSAADSQNSNNE
jgi:hypothetical protein